MTTDIRLETLSTSHPLAVVRRQSPLRDLPSIIPEACGLVWNTLRTHGVTGTGRHVSLYLHTHLNPLTVEVGVELSTPLATPVGEVIPSTLPTGPVATATHFGPYPTLPQTHQALRDWCTQNHHEFAGPNWELYGHWLDAWNTDPSQIRTDVFYLLKPSTPV